MKKILTLAVCIFVLTLFNSANALEMFVYQNEYNTTTISYTMTGIEMFYTNNTAFINDITFYYDAGMLRITVHAPSTVGDRIIHILSNRVEEGENNTYVATVGNYIDTLILKVRESIEPEENETETEDSDCQIFISVIGRAFYGKNLLIHTTDDDSKDVIANVVGQDGVGNSLICQTNNPFKGYCNLFIPEDSEPDIILLASKDGCDTGQYIISKLEGQQLKQEEEEEEQQKTLSIVGLPSEIHIYSTPNGTILDSDGVLVLERARINITDPTNTPIDTTANNGLFKFYAGLLGEYRFQASLDGYNPSPEYIVKVITPRKELKIIPFINGERVTDLTVYEGDTIEVGLFSGDTKVSMDATAKVRYNGEEQDLEFFGGESSMKMVSQGTFTISIPQSEGHLAGETEINVLEGFSFGDMTWWIIGFIVLIAFILFVWMRRGRSSGEIDYSEPPDSEAHPDEIRFVGE